jgi:DNA processing protein
MQKKPNPITSSENPNAPLVYHIALSMLPGIGPVTAKKMVAYTGSTEAVFKESKKNLERIPGVGEYMASLVINQKVIDKAAKEVEFAQNADIKTLFYLDKEYPRRLVDCPDAPIVLFTKGNVDWNYPKILSFVGTRKATQQGKELCENLVASLTERGHNPVIVSGLAYGIDITSHKAALKNNLPTIAVLAHGLKTIYPSQHANVAEQIIEHGALITEFSSDIFADRSNFIRRNRIIAGLADATIVIESGEKGGALITADIANSYNRDVFAVPGRVDDERSKGCNKLIKTNKASLLETVEDLEYVLGWESSNSKKQPIQKQLFIELQPDEQVILDLIRESVEIPIDSICYRVDMPVSRVSPILLNLEFSGLIRSLPGKIYKAR